MVSLAIVYKTSLSLYKSVVLGGLNMSQSIPFLKLEKERGNPPFPMLKEF